MLKKRTYVLQESGKKLLKNQSTLQIVRHLFSISEYLFIGKFVLKNNQPSFLLKIERKAKFFLGEKEVPAKLALCNLNFLIFSRIVCCSLLLR